VSLLALSRIVPAPRAVGGDEADKQPASWAQHTNELSHRPVGVAEEAQGNYQKDAFQGVVGVGQLFSDALERPDPASAGHRQQR
jgi:hypothetical protein